jgi:homoserine kinase
VRVPATSANLGPGFDTFGLALGLYDEVMVRIADSGLHIDVAGEGADDVARDERHLVVRAMRAAFDRLGGQPPGLEVVCANRIPHGRGLGSSAAAICAGIVAARALTVGGAALSDDDLLQLANELEGHPDNVAACLRGGFTVAWIDRTGEIDDRSSDPGSAHALRLDPAPNVAAVAFVPSTPLSTEVARGLLPRTVPHADAARNAGRSALLAAALLQGRTDLLLAATQDRLHQSYRAPAMPESAALVAALRAAGHAAVVSGAGPTVLVLTDEAQLEAVVKTGTAAVGSGWRALGLAVDSAGAVSLGSAEGAVGR